MRPIFATASALIVATPAASGAPLATIASGVVAGVRQGGVVSFLGIPYAAPPDGALRWRAPQPAAAWKGVRAARRYAPDCMQKPFPSDAAPLGTTPAEDCLYANVWRPAKIVRPLPVMVWIHGGGFVNGGSSPPTYAGDALARRGIVVVSFNYRLGRFGTFAHPQLLREDPDRGLRANYGYMDQLAALRWVRRNIAAFGGDPRRVTVVGESAGGISVHMLMTSPQATGLFARAVIQSGGPIDLGDASPASARAASLAFARSVGIADADPEALAKLRALTPAQVTGDLNLATLVKPAGQPKTYSGPAIDGRVAVDSLAAYRNGRFAHVPVMVGATSADIGGPAGPMIQGARTVARALARQGVPVYAYCFSYVASSVRTSGGGGAAHATDIPFFLDTAAIKYGAATSPSDRRAARLASGYLVNFVKTGDPNDAGLPRWKRFEAGKPALLDLDAAGGAVETSRCGAAGPPGGGGG